MIMMRTCVAFIGLFLTNMANAQNFEEIETSILLKVDNSDAILADIDNDGDNDLILSGSTGNNDYTYAYKNDGYAYFSVFQSSGLPNVSYSGLAVGDIDGDNDLDLFVTGYWGWSGPHSELFKNDGTGHFSTVNMQFDNVYSGKTRFFDADNDGDLDLFYFGNLSLGSKVSKLYLNDGAGNFSDSGQNLPPNTKGSLDIADVNNDGAMDILMCGESSGVNNNGTTQLLLNNGSGVFNDSGQSFTNIMLGNAKFVDLEEDGDQDIIVNGILSGVWTLHSTFYTNDGLGNYTSVGNRGLDSLQYNSLIFGDIDLDGDQDIFLSGRTSDNIDTCAFYFNNDGYFEKSSGFSHFGLSFGTAVLGRMNKDCAPDLFYCGFGNQCQNESFLFRNVFAAYYDCIEEEDEEEEDVVYSVFSNPTSDFIRVEVSANVEYVALYDDRGRLVRENYQDDSTIVIDINDLSDGVYILKFRTTKNVEFTEKCIIAD
jgi:Secretion system C-terminal sorting domain/FG-GAP-like repeat